MRDLVHRISINQSIVSTAVTSGNIKTNGASFSILGWESVTGLMRISARVDGTYQPTLEFSADNVNFYTLDATGYIGAVAPGTQNAVGDFIFGVLQLTSAAAVAAGVANTALIWGRVCVTQAAGTTGATFQGDLILAFPRHSGNAV